MPKVNVIIPTYNRAEMVCEAINSVLAQTMQDVEVVVIDDGSTDGTAGLLHKRYGQQIKYFYQENSGRSAARNRGINAATGRYVLFLDSDDMLLPQALVHETKYLDNHPEIDVVYTDGFFCDEHGENFSQINKARPAHQPDDILDDLVISNVILACHSAMVRRTALESVAPPYFDETLGGTEDENLWIRIAALGNKFSYLDVPTCKYCVHDSNSSKYDPDSPVFKRHQESVKASRFKILYADFFPRLRPNTRECFFYKLLLYTLENDAANRRDVLNSLQFRELPPPVQARLLYYLGVHIIVTEKQNSVGREYLKKAVNISPRNQKYRAILWVSYWGQSLLKGIISIRRAFSKARGEKPPPSPIGEGGLHPLQKSPLTK